MMQSTNENAHGEVGVCVAGRQPEAALKNVQLDYTPLADLVQANIAGQRAADIILHDVKVDCADPDAAFLAIKRMLPRYEDANTLAALRGFCRSLQKAIEHGVNTDEH